jgi:hypothetical protein
MRERSPLELSEWIDLEVRLQRDESLPATELTARDAALGRALLADASVGPATPAAERVPYVRRWLAAVHGRDERPGDLVARTLQRARAGVVLAGLALGAGSMAALLHYDGTTPINVLHVLGLFVGAQLAILALLLAHLRRHTGPGLLFGRSLLHELLRAILYARAKVSRRSRTVTDDTTTAGNTRFATTFGQAETWLLVRLTQSFGVAFNAGALVVLAYLVTFTDLAFAWSTTLDLSSRTVHALTDALSWPWAWLDSARPSAALVEATRYARYGGRYVTEATGPRAVDPAVVGSWWPFLAAAIVTYGLLPRLAMLIVAELQVRKALRALRLDAVEIEALWQRLVSGGAVARGAGNPAAVAASSGLDSAGAAVALPDARYAVVLWRDVPSSDAAATAYVRRCFGSEPVWVGRAGGTAGDLDAEAAVRALAVPSRAADAAPPAVIVVVEVFEAFDKSLRHFVAGLRAGLGPERALWIAPVDATADAVTPASDAQKLGVWRRMVAAAADRYLGVPRGATGGLT